MDKVDAWQVLLVTQSPIMNKLVYKKVRKPTTTMLLRILFILFMLPFTANAFTASNGATISNGGGVAASDCSGCSSSSDTEVWANSFTYTNKIQTSFRLAYPFSVAADTCVTGVKVMLTDNGAAIGATCQVWNSSTGTPTSIVGAGYTASVADLPNDGGTYQEFIFSSTQTLSAGSYFISCITDGAQIMLNWESETGGSLQYFEGTWKTDYPAKWPAALLGCDL